MIDKHGIVFQKSIARYEMEKIRIKDIYAGKPDAKDEITFDGFEDFIKTYVVAEQFDIDSLIHGNKCFITGFKGTGKTALLFYLDSQIMSLDESVCSSFVFFKEDFADVRREQLQAISSRIMSTITVERSALIPCDEFEYIWRWLFFKRIIADNEEYHRNLFVDDSAWQSFEKLMQKISAPNNTAKMRVPKSIKFALPMKDFASLSEISPEVEIDLGDPSNRHFNQFVELIDRAETALTQAKRTDIPYYIFVDELEAYYGDEDVFYRDLGLIRDLVFSVKRLNTIFKEAKFQNTKVICSVRSEILNAISRFIVAKEINKVTSGFSVPLVWNYTNSNSYAHPIIQIILKRIAICAKAENDSMLDIYNTWFPEKIHEIEPASYILNNSWCKPRDIVRFITSAQNSLQRNNTSFTQTVFDSLRKDYSDESLIEIKEELRALYASRQIDTIISCFTGFKVAFSFIEISDRVKKYFPNTVLGERLNDILNDLYRLGFLGNYFPATKSYHWQHKGDSQLILSDEWRMFIHYALHNALSLRSQNDRVYNQAVGLQPGDTARVRITSVIRAFAIGTFNKYDRKHKGQIHISEFRKLGHGYIPKLSEVVKPNDEYDVVIKSFNEKYKIWNLDLNM